MDNKKKHINQLVHEDFFKGGKIAFEKSEADVWADLERKLSAPASPSRTISLGSVVRWSAAAVFLLLVGFATVVFTYTQDLETRPGEHLTAQLPDGSAVELNAGSSLSYYPLKWHFERKVTFEGEGYFTVSKGKSFEVISKNGITTVLGTSFNIYARDDEYRVSCLSGKVEVALASKESVLLLPNDHVELSEGKLVVTPMVSGERAIGWTTNQFFFANRPLKEVIDEIERQYAVTIELAPELNNRNFGSNFSKKYSVEEVLEFVCKPMNLKFVKQTDNTYRIVARS